MQSTVIRLDTKLTPMGGYITCQIIHTLNPFITNDSFSLSSNKPSSNYVTAQCILELVIKTANIFSVSYGDQTKFFYYLTPFAQISKQIMEIWQNIRSSKQMFAGLTTSTRMHCAMT